MEKTGNTSSNRITQGQIGHNQNNSYKVKITKRNNSHKMDIDDSEGGKK